MWKSSDKSIATVSNGKVTGISEGTAIITATVGSGSNNKKFTCKVTVKPRLSVDNSNITLLLDEYQEIEVNFKKPKDGERLAYITNTDVVQCEWVDDDEKHIIRIIPEKIGTASITVCTVSGKDFFNKTINKGESLNINITVLRDYEWISREDLFDFGVSVYDWDNTILFSRFNKYRNDTKYINSYVIENIEEPIVKNKIYESNEIHYKLENDTIYFKIEDLKKLKII